MSRNKTNEILTIYLRRGGFIYIKGGSINSIILISKIGGTELWMNARLRVCVKTKFTV